MGYNLPGTNPARDRYYTPQFRADFLEGNRSTGLHGTLGRLGSNCRCTHATPSRHIMFLVILVQIYDDDLTLQERVVVRGVERDI